jgi:hypothetical protein
MDYGRESGLDQFDIDIDIDVGSWWTCYPGRQPRLRFSSAETRCSTVLRELMAAVVERGTDTYTVWVQTRQSISQEGTV